MPKTVKSSNEALKIPRRIQLRDHGIDLAAIRSQGPGRQNVNKVGTSIHLAFDT